MIASIYTISGGIFNCWTSVLEVNLKARNVSQVIVIIDGSFKPFACFVQDYYLEYPIPPNIILNDLKFTSASDFESVHAFLFDFRMSLVG